MQRKGPPASLAEKDSLLLAQVALWQLSRPALAHGAGNEGQMPISYSSAVMQQSRFGETPG